MSYFKSMHGGKDNDNDDIDDDHSNNSSVAGSESEEESDAESLKNVDEEGDDEAVDDEVDEVGDDEIDEDVDIDEDIEDADEDEDDLGEGDSEEEEDADEDGDEEGEIVTPSRKKKTMKIAPSATTVKKSSIIPSIGDLNLDDNDSDEDEDEDGEMYLKKFDKETNDNYLLNFHPESTLHNYDEVLAMTKVVRDKHGVIVDALHKTIPYLNFFIFFLSPQTTCVIFTSCYYCVSFIIKSATKYFISMTF
jgi:hypothetical protein